MNGKSGSVSEESGDVKDSTDRVEAGGKGEKQTIKTIFNSLRRFKDSRVTIFFYGGDSVVGRLIGYDEVANCVLERENEPTVVVLGRAITMVCEGLVHPL